ncbi:UDP-N-acetylenolpyruvoylglucosamine reductase [Thalassobaculum fulvum]|uniref:UDP-N-acetylenolpyruvoylglucosamine reductase n=2 Tax=Thalassobaculum fulvum TaxID=1633335 RepID=A0A918XT46_9PROT|nr:UDP-N-acetylenolpyruvoylglucosamine reductase [Thalassobaculum fulvum]
MITLASPRHRKPMTHLIERLPPVRGEYRADAPTAQLTWFRVGGPAEVLFRPADEADLIDFLAERPGDVPVTVLGVGSNVLIRGGGIRGVVVRLGKAFAETRIDGDRVTAGAGALDVTVAATAQRAGLTGLEFLSGIPGTVGGALRMNAGAYGAEVKDVLVSARAIDGLGHVHTLAAADMGLSYRHCAVPEDWIFTSAVFQARPGDPATIAQAMADIRDAREDTQPRRVRTGGSTFANPAGHKAWQLIDAAGCRGLKIGGAQVSEKHCNFLLNVGNATAEDIEALGEEVRRRVRNSSGIELRWEIRRIGVAKGAEGGAA